MSAGILEQLLERVDRLEAELAELRGKREAGEITVAEYAARRSLSPSTVRNMIRDGRLPAKRVGRLVRIPSDAAIGSPIATSAPTTARERARRLLGGNGGAR